MWPERSVHWDWLRAARAEVTGESALVGEVVYMPMTRSKTSTYDIWRWCTMWVKMARRRFFVPEIRRGLAALTDADAEHLVRVLRVEAGQVFELSDNQNVYLAEVASARKSNVEFRIIEQLPAPATTVHVTLLAALIKFEHFEWLVEKAT